MPATHHPKRRHRSPHHPVPFTVSGSGHGLPSRDRLLPGASQPFSASSLLARTQNTGQDASVTCMGSLSKQQPGSTVGGGCWPSLGLGAGSRTQEGFAFSPSSLLGSALHLLRLPGELCQELAAFCSSPGSPALSRVLPELFLVQRQDPFPLGDEYRHRALRPSAGRPVPDVPALPCVPRLVLAAGRRNQLLPINVLCEPVNHTAQGCPGTCSFAPAEWEAGRPGLWSVTSRRGCSAGSHVDHTGAQHPLPGKVGAMKHWKGIERDFSSAIVSHQQEHEQRPLGVLGPRVGGPVPLGSGQVERRGDCSLCQVMAGWGWDPT